MLHLDISWHLCWFEQICVFQHETLEEHCHHSRRAKRTRCLSLPVCCQDNSCTPPLNPKSQQTLFPYGSLNVCRNHSGFCCFSSDFG